MSVGSRTRYSGSWHALRAARPDRVTGWNVSRQLNYRSRFGANAGMDYMVKALRGERGSTPRQSSRTERPADFVASFDFAVANARWNYIASDDVVAGSSPAGSAMGGRSSAVEHDVSSTNSSWQRI